MFLSFLHVYINKMYGNLTSTDYDFFLKQYGFFVYMEHFNK